MSLRYGAEEIAASKLFVRARIAAYAAASILFVIFPFAQVYQTRIAPLFLTIAALIVLVPEVLIWRKSTNQAQWLSTVKSSPALVAFWLLWAWMALSTAWSPLPEKAIFSSATIAAFALCVWLLSRAIGRLNRIHLFWIISIAMILSGSFLISELNHFTLIHYHGAAQRTHDLNRNVLMLGSLIWPLLLLCNFEKRQIVSVALAIGITTVAVFLSHSGSAKLALVASACVFICLKVLPKLTPVAYLALAALVVSTPIWVTSINQFTPNLQNKNIWSAAARMDIWNGHIELLRKKPIIGYGAFGDRYMGKQNEIPYVGTRKGKSPGVKFTVHAHSSQVQIWFNFGLVGALLLSGFFCAIGWTTRLFEPHVSAIIFATITALHFSTIAGASVFQGWILANIAITASILIAAVTIYRSKKVE